MSRCLPIAVLMFGTAVLLPVADAQSQGTTVCGSRAVSARGENSRFAWIAKSKARANWRREVRSTPGLGPDFANWARAQNTEERCLAGPVGTVCIFTGVPCKD